jgi:ferredoxin
LIPDLCNVWPFLRKFSIEFDEHFLTFWQFIFRENCIGWTFWFTQCAVDTFVWINNEKIWTFIEAVYWALCEPECPANAILSEDELPEGQEVFIELNAELAQKWPNITQIGDQPADREEWNGKTDKLQYLEK